MLTESETGQNDIQYGNVLEENEDKTEKNKPQQLLLFVFHFF